MNSGFCRYQICDSMTDIAIANIWTSIDTRNKEDN